MLLQGLFVPLTCPFYRDGVSYLRKLEANVARYSLGPAAGLFALPPNGESGALTDLEGHAFLHAAGEVAGNEKVLLAGVERNSVAAALGMTDIAAAAGFDAVVLAPPTDWARLIHGHDARELLTFYQTVADGSALPVVLWSDATPPSLQLPVNLLASLAAHPNIIGLVDADLSVARASELLVQTEAIRREVTVTTVFAAVTRRMQRPVAAPIQPAPGFVNAEALTGGASVSAAVLTPAPAVPTLKTRTRVVGFQLISAAPAHGMVPLLETGVVGAAPTLASAAPQACFEAYAAWKDGDRALAEERATRLQAAEETILPKGPAAIKAACDFNGYFGGVPRLPRLSLIAEDRAAVERALSTVRN